MLDLELEPKCVRPKAHVLLTSKPLFSKCCRLWGWEVLKNAVLALRPRLTTPDPGVKRRVCVSKQFFWMLFNTLYSMVWWFGKH